MTYSISLERMDEIRPLLEKHYRLGTGYFTHYYNKESVL